MSDAYKESYVQELLPVVDPKEKNITFIDYMFIWAGMAINMGAFAMGAQYYPGLSPLQLIGAIIVGYGLVTLVLTLTGDIGIRHGVPFSIYLRVCFGHKGYIIPSIMRAIPCAFWYGYQTWVGGAAMNVILYQLTGYSNVAILMTILCIFQIWNAAMGLKAIAKFDWIAIPLLALLLGAMTFWVLKTNDVAVVDIFALPGDGSGSFMLAVSSIAGIWITMAINNMDLTRNMVYKKEWNDSESFIARNWRVFLGAVIGLITCGMGILIVGMMNGFITGVWDPILMITTALPNPIVLILAMLVIIFAQVSTTISGCLYPTALIVCTVFKKVSYKMGVVISGLIGMAMMAWVFNDYLTYATVIFMAMLGPIAGIIIADYFIIRKGKLDVNSLYTLQGIRAWDWKTLGIYFISFALCFVNDDYAFFISLGVAFVLYSLLQKNRTDAVPEDDISQKTQKDIIIEID